MASAIASLGCVIPGMAALDPLFGLSARLADRCPPSEESLIKAKMEILCKRLGITKDISVGACKEFDDQVISSSGNTWFPCKASILINRNYWDKLSDGEQEYLLARELVVLDSNTTLKSCILAAVVAVIMSIVLTILFPLSITLSAAALFSGVFGMMIGRLVFTTDPDRKALAVCSPEAQQAANAFPKNR